MRHFVFACALAALATAGANAQYNPQLAMTSLYFCKAAYCAPSSISAWSCGPTCSALGALESISVFDNAAAESQSYVAYSPGLQAVIVAFRGTSNVQNWIQDLTFIKTTYPNANCVGCEVHKGFLEEWQSYNTSVLQAVQGLRSTYSGAPILVTGHSLGAAVSLLAALDIINLLGVASSQVSLYNFGEPRVGTPTFVAWAVGQLNGGVQYRVTHAADPVPHLPPEAFGFLHAPHELWYDNNGNTTYSNCQDSVTAEDPACSDSVLIPADVSDHLLYLGVCTECTCNGDAASGAFVAAAMRQSAQSKPQNVPRTHKRAVIVSDTRMVPAKRRRDVQRASRKQGEEFREVLKKKLNARPETTHM